MIKSYDFLDQNEIVFLRVVQEEESNNINCNNQKVRLAADEEHLHERGDKIVFRSCKNATATIISLTGPFIISCSTYLIKFASQAGKRINLFCGYGEFHLPCSQCDQ